MDHKHEQPYVSSAFQKIEYAGLISESKGILAYTNVAWGVGRTYHTWFKANGRLEELMLHHSTPKTVH